MTNETNNSRPTHRVFAVTKNGKKKFWQPIGALWAHGLCPITPFCPKTPAVAQKAE
jgi:hypothetical protein